MPRNTATETETVLHTAVESFAVRTPDVHILDVYQGMKLPSDHAAVRQRPELFTLSAEGDIAVIARRELLHAKREKAQTNRQPPPAPSPAELGALSPVAVAHRSFHWQNMAVMAGDAHDRDSEVVRANPDAFH